MVDNPDHHLPMADCGATLLMKKATIIFNPRAGQLNMTDKIEPVAEFWRKRGWRVHLRPTEAPGHATELARRAADAGEHLVLAAGGDGTMGQVANGLADSETILAPLPVGTSNALARELKLPRPQLLDPNAPLMASEALLGGRVHHVDLNFTQIGPVRAMPCSGRASARTASSCNRSSQGPCGRSGSAPSAIAFRPWPCSTGCRP